MAIAKHTYSPIQIYKRLLSISGRYWPVFLGVAASASLFAATDAGFAYLVATLTEIVEAGSNLTERQEFIKQWLPLAVLLLFASRGVCNFLSNYGMGWLARITVKELRGRVFEHYLELPTSFFDHSSSGQLLSKLTYDVNQVAQAASNVVIVLFKDSLTILFLVLYMLYLSPALSVFVFIVAPIIALIVRFLSNVFRRHNKKIQTSVGDITRIGEEALQANKIIKVFSGQSYESSRFDAANERNRRTELRLLVTKSAGDAVTVFVTAFGVAGVIYLINKIDIDVSRVAGFITAMVMLMGPLKRLTNVNATIQSAIAAGESLFSIIDTPKEIDTGQFNPDTIKGSVNFKNIQFGYENVKEQVLTDINIHVSPGESLAIVGRSGSGKSTLVSLLPRFYDPEAGEILIDDHSTTEFSLSGLRKHISLVNQEVTLFNDTIAANIAYGSLANASEDAIRSSAEAANVTEFTKQMPDGLNTVVGDRGVLLSGGQRQRISIARALLKNSPILILDEATSALDTQSERHIQAALDKLMQNRTTFVIAHRLSTIEKVDRIIVMDAGRIIETGRHEELLAAGGAYAALYRLQFRDDNASKSA
ncbi:MAG: lipid A export permease/ATP-binding protein MsbA [Gammaproteobacteria bacterium]|nr:lipid A export permease/ATP-binding protein MsbA [Gammaproteobacteria bacterium]MCP4088770.1 lipid A export permease/ATP-binding protein MsbA [Gammaproteobacteria bacterium]MCP4275931.1 lipid A export permease/ATP-binding protein MsbA [Gammaproteobacteria bacterium]MCP4832147.1 lipid A export permease/ATP-binding protein MsbA [Gammaproteobacteria bacterium]MCP4928252.1 lipid A export permease/ATP-binding protein MsbA [Gammaproteobacteria bacterium]